MKLRKQLLIIATLACMHVQADNVRHDIFMDRPAAEWNEALPIANSQMGCMVWGEVSHERLPLYHITRPGGVATFQPDGFLELDFGSVAEPSHYERRLDLATACVMTKYTSNRIRYEREYLASLQDSVIVMHVGGSSLHSVSLKATLDSQGLQESIAQSDKVYRATLTIPQHNDEQRLMVSISTTDGHIQVTGQAIEVEKATEVTIVIGKGNHANTTYNFAQLKQRHINAFRAAYRNKTLDLRGPDLSQLPIQQRMLQSDTTNDSKLAELFYQYGRYLSIVCAQNVDSSKLATLCQWARQRNGNKAWQETRQRLMPTTAGQAETGCPNMPLENATTPASLTVECSKQIEEMLLQSHEGVVDLLPALPSDWPQGIVRGLKAQNQFTVDIYWRKGKLTKACIHCDNGGNLRLRTPNEVKTVRWAVRIPPMQNVTENNGKEPIGYTYDIMTNVGEVIIVEAVENINE